MDRSMSKYNRIPKSLALILLLLLLCWSRAWAETDPLDELAPNAPKTGSQAPDFSAEEAFGKTIRLKEELKEHNVLLLFYRGVF